MKKSYIANVEEKSSVSLDNIRKLSVYSGKHEMDTCHQSENEIIKTNRKSRKELALLKKDHIFVIRKQKNPKKLKQIVCKFPKCRLLFNTKLEYKAHTSAHSTSQFYKCYIEGCNKCFKKSNSLKRHLAEHNSLLKDFYCIFCNLTFNKYTSLKLHLNKSHKQQKLKQTKQRTLKLKFISSKANQKIITPTLCSSLITESNNLKTDSPKLDINELDIINAGLELIGMKKYEEFDSNLILSELIAFKDSIQL